MIKPIFEFVVWNNCSNSCLFCKQKSLNQNLSDEQKITSLDILNHDLLNIIEKKSHILIVGGEIFDQQSNTIKNKIINIYNKIINLQKQNYIDNLYISTNLLYDTSFLVNQILDKILNNNLEKRLIFTTSYDIFGRFQNEYSKKIFIENLSKISKKYKINITINSILTKQLCNLLYNNITELDFLLKYGNINLIPYISYNDIFQPDRKILFEVLRNINNHWPNYIFNNIKNLDLKQDKKIYRFINNKYVYSSEENNVCGHCLNFNKYSNNNSCYICDIKKLFAI